MHNFATKIVFVVYQYAHLEKKILGNKLGIHSVRHVPNVYKVLKEAGELQLTTTLAMHFTVLKHNTLHISQFILYAYSYI